MPALSASEAPACPACGGATASAPIAWARAMSIHRCQACALRFARPVPSAAELDAFYQGFLYRKPSRKKLPRLLRARERELRSSFALSGSPEANAGKSFLDHGGGTGAAYGAARRLGLDSWFSDMDAGWLSPGGLVLRVWRAGSAREGG
jgi:hypothetical protein